MSVRALVPIAFTSAASTRLTKALRGEGGGSRAKKSRGDAAQHSALPSTHARDGGAAHAWRRSPTSHVPGAPSSHHSSPSSDAATMRSIGMRDESAARATRASRASPVSVGSPEGRTASVAVDHPGPAASGTTRAVVSSVRRGPTSRACSAAIAVNSLTHDAGTSAASGSRIARSPRVVECTSTPHVAGTRSSAASMRAWSSRGWNGEGGGSSEPSSIENGGCG